MRKYLHTFHSTRDYYPEYIKNLKKAKMQNTVINGQINSVDSSQKTSKWSEVYENMFNITNHRGNKCTSKQNKILHPS